MPLPTRLSDFPALPLAVTVVFRGLLTFCFDGPNNCEVGVLNINTIEPTQPHDLAFRKWIKTGVPTPVCPANAEPARVYPTPANTFELRVNGPHPSVNGVFFIGGNSFNRAAINNHPQDLRWMIDFESTDIHNFVVPKFGNRVTPRLTINKGVFYTHHTTLTKFVALPSSGSGDPKILGSIAEVMAARIYLDASGSVDVIIDGNTEETLSPAAGEHQIDVFNLCNPATHAGCRYLAAHPTDKKRRNDFYLYYEAINRTGVDENGNPVPPVEEFQLMASFPTVDSTITGICRRIGESGTDPAPCGPGGFGGTFPFG